MDVSPISYQPPDLKGRVALVAGATRGVGRGTALALGEAGATVYCTGRSTRANRVPRDGAKKVSPFDYTRRPETIEETAEMVTARGGKGVAVVVDHTETKQVEALIARIRKEQGKLHILVNDISEADSAGSGEDVLATESGERTCEFAKCNSHAHHHQSFRGAFADRDGEGRDSAWADRGDRRRRLVHVSRAFVLRPGEDHGDSNGVWDGAGAAAEECGGGGVDAGISCGRRPCWNISALPRRTGRMP